MTQTAYQDIPGLPEPSTKDHTSYIDQFVNAVAWAHKRRNAPDHITDAIADFIIYISFLISETQSWITAFTDAQRKAASFYRNPDTYYRVIAFGVSTPEVERVVMLCLPNLDREKYFPHDITLPVPQTITPQATPRLKPSPPRPRKETIFQFIPSHAPSIIYLQGFIFLSRHTTNHLSTRGRKVYPYGQKYAARQLQTSQRTVDRIFSWLRHQGIIFKRSNENPKLHQSATWFVCTTWKQSAYFRDPEGRRPKKGSLRSRRKRHLPSVHT